MCKIHCEKFIFLKRQEQQSRQMKHGQRLYFKGRDRSRWGRTALGHGPAWGRTAQGQGPVFCICQAQRDASAKFPFALHFILEKTNIMLESDFRNLKKKWRKHLTDPRPTVLPRDLDLFPRKEWCAYISKWCLNSSCLLISVFKYYTVSFIWTLFICQSKEKTNLK